MKLLKDYKWNNIKDNGTIKRYFTMNILLYVIIVDIFFI
ncbi:hypothetical protein CLOSBL3_12137 [Clostridiaceae bacterium BL-3]|nr:hypothetical protein CLOSBL3_12137 [Clostridiaceae bacterium BL-3]